MLGLNLFPEELACSTKVLFINLGEAEAEASMRIMGALRNNGIAAEIYPESAKMKKQMEYANRRGIPYVVIIGSEELGEGIATIKDMRTGEQAKVRFEEVVEHIK
jgi:histidyl-tRNA synthetase